MNLNFGALLAYRTEEDARCRLGRVEDIRRGQATLSQIMIFALFLEEVAGCERARARIIYDVEPVERREQETYPLGLLRKYGFYFNPNEFEA